MYVLFLSFCKAKPIVQRDEEALLTDAIAAIKGGKVPYNSVTCVSVGPGGAGKTATRRSIQGLAFEEDRKSTVGGEHLDLIIQLVKGDMVSMKQVDHVRQLERAFAVFMQQTTDGCFDDAFTADVGNLIDMVRSNSSYKESEALRDQLDLVEAALRSQDASSNFSPKPIEAEKKKESIYSCPLQPRAEQGEAAAARSFEY